jgi:hypothetical protein
MALAKQAFVLLRDASARVAALDVDRRRADLLPVDGEACDAVLEVATSPRAVVLTSRGRVERFDLVTRERRSGTDVAAPFACSDPDRPRIVAGPGRAWVSAPAAGELVEIDTDAGAVARKIPIGGTPGAVTILGLAAYDADLAVGDDALTD